MDKEKIIKELKRIDEKCCEAYSVYIFLEELKEDIAKQSGITKEEMKKNHIFVNEY